MSDVWMNCKETAEYLGVAHRTLQHWRSNGYGPKFILRGRILRYRRSDVDAWLEEGASKGKEGVNKNED